MSKTEEETFQRLMADFAQDQGRRLLELEQDLPPLPEEEQLRLLEAAQIAKQARQIPIQPARPWRRYAAAAALALLAGATIAEAMTQKTAREMTIELRNNGAYYGVEKEEPPTRNLIGKYLPTWLPEGYEMDSDTEWGEPRWISYYNQASEYGFISFCRMTDSDGVVTTTQMGETVEPVWVGEKEGGLIAKLPSSGLDWELFWHDTEAQSYFSLQTKDITKDELFAIAESVQRVN